MIKFNQLLSSAFPEGWKKDFYEDFSKFRMAESELEKIEDLYVLIERDGKKFLTPYVEPDTDSLFADVLMFSVNEGLFYFADPLGATVDLSYVGELREIDITNLQFASDTDNLFTKQLAKNIKNVYSLLDFKSDNL